VHRFASPGVPAIADQRRPRQFVLFLEGCGAHATTVEWTVELAREHGAHLTGVFVDQEEVPRRGETDPRAVFEAVARRHGIRWAWRRVSPRPVVEMATFGPFAELAVVARRPQRSEPSARPALWESLLRAYGRSTLVLPPAGLPARPRRIVVGWSASDDALDLTPAIPFLERAQAVEIVPVEHDDIGSLRVEAAGFARALAGRGIPVGLDPLPSRAGDGCRTLLSRAAARCADLLVVGARCPGTPTSSRPSSWRAALGAQLRSSVTPAARAEAAVPVMTCC
jgi:hypothetical protein